jgi:hypothetical protein
MATTDPSGFDTAVGVLSDVATTLGDPRATGGNPKEVSVIVEASMGEREKYDARQLTLMERRIAQFENGEVSRSALIDDLDALLSSLQSTWQPWKEAFKSEWWTLEQISAVALDRGEGGTPEGDRALVTDALIHLKELIEQAKQRL